MNASARLQFVEKIRHELELRCHINFNAYPSFDSGDNKSAPARRYYFAPEKFHFAKVGDSDAKRVGFVVVFEERDVSPSAYLRYGFQITHGYSAGFSLKKWFNQNPQHFQEWLKQQSFKVVYIDEKYSKTSLHHNVGLFWSKTQDFCFEMSGSAEIDRLDLNSIETWERLFKNYPWRPDRESKTKGEKTYLSLQHGDWFKVKSSDLQEAAARIAKILVTRYMPLLEACAIHRRQPAYNIKRPHSHGIRSALDKLYPDGLRCAVHPNTESLAIHRAHLVSAEDLVGCVIRVQELGHSPANIIPLCANCHDIQEKKEKWYIGPGKKIYRGAGSKKGTIVRLFLSPAHRRMLRDLRRLSLKKVVYKRLSR